MLKAAKKMVVGLMIFALVLGLASIALADTVTVSGQVIAADGGGFALEADDKTYVLKGDSVKDDMIDQQVEVTGTVSQDDGGNDVITVESIQVK